MKRLALALVFLCLARAVRAEDVPLSLAEAMEKARIHSARLAQLAALEGAAAEGLRGARAQRWPVIDLQGSYSYNSDVPELALVARCRDVLALAREPWLAGKRPEIRDDQGIVDDCQPSR